MAQRLRILNANDDHYPIRRGRQAMNVKTVLVPLDGSIFAEAALATAVDLAR
jgi:hypothetical protein